MKFRKWLIALLVVLLPVLAQAQGTPPGIVTTNQLGAANGVAPLDGTAKVPTANLPAVTTQGGLAAANNLSDVANAATARTNLGAAPLASPTFTGTPTVPGYLTTGTAASTYAPLASPTFTGTVTIPTGASIAGYDTTSARISAISTALPSTTVNQLYGTTTTAGVAQPVTVSTGLSATAGALSILYGTTAGTAAQGNDSRITGALQPATVTGVVASSGSAFRAAMLSDLTGLGAVSAAAPNITAPLKYNGSPGLVIAYGNYTPGGGSLLPSCLNNCDTLVGYGAGANLPSSEYLTTAVGNNALGQANAVNTEATAFGIRAGSQLTGAGPYFVSLFGINALGLCTTACTNDTIIGNDAAIGALTMTNSTAVGNYVFQNFAGNYADSLIGIGQAAVRWNGTATGAQYLIGIGNFSLFGDNATTAFDLTAIGDHALYSVTSAHTGVAIGQSTGRNATTDSSFLWIGRGAAANASGSQNTVIIGTFAVSNNTFSGYQDNIIGGSAGNSLTTGYQDNFFGYQACSNATTAFAVTCIGDNVGATVTTGVGLLLLSSGRTPVEPTATNFSINIENIITATGTATPSTSVTTIAGIENVVGARQANGTAGQTCSGTPTASFATINGLVTHC